MKATIIYWRDIPTQIAVGTGRKAAKVQLADRFMVAVDKAAMQSGATDTDAYLADWRRAEIDVPDASPADAAAELAGRIETDYPATRLAELARAGGKQNETGT